MTTWESADKLIKKEILHVGSFSKKPIDLSVCAIHVQNPTSIDLTLDQIKHELYSDIIEEDGIKNITIGEASSDVDRYLETAIKTMFINEQSLITIVVPFKSSKTEKTKISVKVTLDKVETFKFIWEWTSEEKYLIALKHKKKGVELFKNNRQVDAFHKFSKACKILITLEPLDDLKNVNQELFKNVYDLKYILYNNMAECQLTRENYEHVLTLCTKVLNKEEKNIKALYRRGVAYGCLKDFEKAINDLKIVIALKPDDKKVREKFNFYNKQWCSSVQNYENMVKKMFKA